MEHRPTRAQIRQHRLACRVIATACWLVIGFSAGILVTLKVVGFS